ncbi:MAG: hypothetical protein NZO16_02650, partial [Deltaproteobacteria bacterium]|nr:hypothetical protein [Deltaproteobacteria bacterium]
MVSVTNLGQELAPARESFLEEVYGEEFEQIEKLIQSGNCFINPGGSVHAVVHKMGGKIEVRDYLGHICTLATENLTRNASGRRLNSHDLPPLLREDSVLVEVSRDRYNNIRANYKGGQNNNNRRELEKPAPGKLIWDYLLVEPNDQDVVFELVCSESDFQKLSFILQNLPDGGIVGLDCETKQVPEVGERLEMIQICVGNEVYIFRPETFKQFVENGGSSLVENITVHNGLFDVPHVFGTSAVSPRSVEDTMLFKIYPYRWDLSTLCFLVLGRPLNKTARRGFQLETSENLFGTVNDQIIYAARDAFVQLEISRKLGELENKLLEISGVELRQLRQSRDRVLAYAISIQRINEVLELFLEFQLPDNLVENLRKFGFAVTTVSDLLGAIASVSSELVRSSPGIKISSGVLSLVSFPQFALSVQKLRNWVEVPTTCYESRRLLTGYRRSFFKNPFLERLDQYVTQQHDSCLTLDAISLLELQEMLKLLWEALILASQNFDVEITLRNNSKVTVRGNECFILWSLAVRNLFLEMSMSRVSSFSDLDLYKVVEVLTEKYLAWDSDRQQSLYIENPILDLWKIGRLIELPMFMEQTGFIVNVLPGNVSFIKDADYHSDKLHRDLIKLEGLSEDEKNTVVEAEIGGAIWTSLYEALESYPTSEAFLRNLVLSIWGLRHQLVIGRLADERERLDLLAIIAIVRWLRGERVLVCVSSAGERDKFGKRLEDWFERLFPGHSNQKEEFIKSIETVRRRTDFPKNVSAGRIVISSTEMFFEQNSWLSINNREVANLATPLDKHGTISAESESSSSHGSNEHLGGIDTNDFTWTILIENENTPWSPTLNALIEKIQGTRTQNSMILTDSCISDLTDSGNCAVLGLQQSHPLRQLIVCCAPEPKSSQSLLRKWNRLSTAEKRRFLDTFTSAYRLLRENGETG